jgi:uncharacterized membrane protein YbhN (UPF0104 family)
MTSSPGSSQPPAVLARVARALPMVLIAGSVVGLLAFVDDLGLESIASASSRIDVGHFVLICLVYGVSVLADTAGWRYAFPCDRRPPFRRLLAAKCAGEAVNVITALGSVGGEATKAWLLRRDTSYAASVPSLIVAKTSLVVAQTALLVLGILVAWVTEIGGTTLLLAMGSLLVVEAVGVGGFLLVQVVGVVGHGGRVLAWASASGLNHARQLDSALRGFYRREWRSFLLSTAFHFAGWLIGAVEALVILSSLGLSASLSAAMVIEALGSGVRFATFFVPASLGPLEGANAAAFTALGWAASSGLAFTLIRRARQAVWIVVGVAILLAMNAPGFLAGRPLRPQPSGVD